MRRDKLSIEEIKSAVPTDAMVADDSSIETVDQHDRLTRPWTVLIAGTLVPVFVVVFRIIRKSIGIDAIDDKMMTGLIAVGLMSFVLSTAYAFLGYRYSRRLARQVVGAVGGVCLLAGVAYLVYLLNGVT